MGVRNRWPSRGFLAGLALTSCFLALFLPSAVAGLVVLPLVIDIFVRGIRLRPFLAPPPIAIIIGVIAALTIVALGSSDYQFLVIRDLVWSGAMVAFVLLALDPSDHPDDIARGFFAGAAVTATVTGLLGLLKYWLQLKGYISSTILASCGGRYPQGTTFCSDYNLFALYMIVAALGLTVIVFNSRTTAMKVVVVVALGVCLSAGLLAGSRRFAFVAPLVPVLWMLNAILRGRMRSLALSAIPLLIFVTAYVGLDNRNYKAVPDSDVVIIEESFGGIGDTVAGWLRPKPGGMVSYFLSARTVLPDALAGTMDAEASYGLAPRIERWQLGWDMISSDGYLLGRGFTYQRQFACEFIECIHIDYPHLPIMSAWIGFGIAGLVLAFAFYGLTGINILLLAGTSGILSGASFMALAVMPYSLLSGDTIFSMPQAVVGAMLVGVTARMRA